MSVRHKTSAQEESKQDTKIHQLSPKSIQTQDKPDSQRKSYPKKFFRFRKDTDRQPKTPYFKHKKSIPLPIGNFPYAKAKRAEFLEQNFLKAEKFYRKAIRIGNRPESALKDLASLLHSQSRTQEAIQILQNSGNIVIEDKEKYNNLLSTLKKQMIPTGNSLNKILKISELSPDDTEKSVLGLFANPSRVTKVNFSQERGVRSALIHFQSHSSARKTLENFQFFDQYTVEWVSITGHLRGNADPSKYRIEYRRKNPQFEYKLFERDPNDWVMPLPVDCPKSPDLSIVDLLYEIPMENLLGAALLRAIDKTMICLI